MLAQLALFLLFILSFTGMLVSFYLMFRNSEVADFYRRLLNEEGDWLREHPVYFERSKGRFVRYESLPPYHIALYKFWIPLDTYEKPIFSYYQDLPVGSNDTQN